MASSQTNRLTSEYAPSPEPQVLGTELVTLNVGPGAKSFIVHKKRLCNRCEYFFKAFNSGFEEANTRVMNVPDDTEEAFTTFITWLYVGTILLPEIPLSEFTENRSSTSDFIEKYFLPSFIPSFILADKFCNNDLMNKLIDILQDI